MVLLLVICIPRVPSFGFNPAAPLVAGSGDPAFTRGPQANFTFRANLDLQIDTSGNVIPIHLNNIHARIYSSDTQQLIATGDTGGFTRGGNSATPLNMSVLFNYSANNDSDTTCTSLWSVVRPKERWLNIRHTGNLVYNACKSASLYASGSRPGMPSALYI